MGQYDQLASEARRIRRLLESQARRPYVLEITGTPKAGKTTVISLLATFFKSCEWRVRVIDERAAHCAIPMKGHFFFNTWTMCTMLAEVVEAVDGNDDLLILDRGFFDALIWLELQKKRHQVSADEAEVVERFAKLERWRSLVDTTIVMSVPAAIAMEREQLGRFIPRTGSMMNTGAITQFNEALKAARTAHEADFNVIEIEAAGSEVKQVAANIAQTVLNAVEPWADPKIAVVPREALERLLNKPGPHQWSQELAAGLHGAVQPMKRSTAEDDESVVQLVACGIPTFERGVFIFDRLKDGRRLDDYGRFSLWAGKHVPYGDDERPIEARAAEAATERLQTNLHLQLPCSEPPLGVVSTAPQPYPQQDGRTERSHSRSRSQRHLGVMFAVPIQDESVAESLKQKEFKTRGRGHPQRSTFEKLNELTDNFRTELEPWSMGVLEAKWLSS